MQITLLFKKEKIIGTRNKNKYCNVMITCCGLVLTVQGVKKKILVFRKSHSKLVKLRKIKKKLLALYCAENSNKMDDT